MRREEESTDGVGCLWQKDSSKSGREGLQSSSKTWCAVSFGDSDTGKKEGGQTGGGRTEDVKIFILMGPSSSLLALISCTSVLTADASS